MKSTFVQFLLFTFLMGLFACNSQKPSPRVPSNGDEPEDSPGTTTPPGLRNDDTDRDPPPKETLSLTCSSSEGEDYDEDDEFSLKLSDDDEGSSSKTKSSSSKSKKEEKDFCTPSDFKWKSNSSLLLASESAPKVWQFKFDINKKFGDRQFEFFQLLEEFPLSNSIGAFQGKEYQVEWHPEEGDEGLYNEGLKIVARDMSRCYELAKANENLDETDCDDLETLIKDGVDNKIDFVFTVKTLSVKGKSLQNEAPPRNSLYEIFCRGQEFNSVDNAGRVNSIVEGVNGTIKNVQGLDFSKSQDEKDYEKKCTDNPNADGCKELKEKIDDAPRKNNYGSLFGNIGTLIGGFAAGEKKARRKKTGDCFNK